MARNPSSLGRAGENMLRFIGRQQQNAITNRNKGTPVLDVKLKTKTSKLKRKKSLRGMKA